MKKTSRWLFSAAAAAILLATSTVVPATADPSSSESGPVEIEMNGSVDIRDSAGQSLAVLKSSDETGERTIDAVDSKKKAVKVVVYSKPRDYDSEPKPLTVSDTDWTKAWAPGNPTLEEVPVVQPADVKAEMIPTLATGVTNTTVTISWAPTPGIEKYQVTRNGSVVSEDARKSFKDKKLLPGTLYTYEVIGIPANNNDGSVTELRRTIPITTLASDKTTAPADQVVTPLTYQPYNTAFMYKTFIPDARVTLDLFGATSCGVLGQSGYTFGGDNRGFRTPRLAEPDNTQDYRTMMFVTVNWGNPDAYSMITAKGIGATKKYLNGNLVETRVASMNQMLFEDTYRSGSYAQSRFNHKAGNPFCSPGEITYNVLTRLYRSGLVEVVGNRYPVPSHEGYARFNNTGTEFWVNLFNKNNEGFNCLTGLCGSPSLVASAQR